MVRDSGLATVGHGGRRDVPDGGVRVMATACCGDATWAMWSRAGEAKGRRSMCGVELTLGGGGGVDAGEALRLRSSAGRMEGQRFGADQGRAAVLLRVGEGQCR